MLRALSVIAGLIILAALFFVATEIKNDDEAE